MRALGRGDAQRPFRVCCCHARPVSDVETAWCSRLRQQGYPALDTVILELAQWLLWLPRVEG
jgi:hypothetical protein